MLLAACLVFYDLMSMLFRIALIIIHRILSQSSLARRRPQPACRPIRSSRTGPALVNTTVLPLAPFPATRATQEFTTTPAAALACGQVIYHASLVDTTSFRTRPARLRAFRLPFAQLTFNIN